MKEDFRSVEFAPGREISVETGRLAKQADGACVVRMGDTMVLCTAVSNKEPKPGIDFFPLTVDLRENFAAGGRFPGGFIKREGRPSEKEILSSRLIDRVIRPLFPDGYRNETQIICQVISSDGQNDGDVLGGFGASVALTLSDIPFQGPMAEVRVGRLEGEMVINPTIDQLEESDIDMIVGGTADSIVMVEGEAMEISEQEMIEALKAAHDAIKKLCVFQEELREELGVENREFTPEEPDEELQNKVNELLGNQIEEVVEIGLDKETYNEKIKAIIDQVVEDMGEEYEEQEGEIKSICRDREKKALRSIVLNQKRRIDGRSPEDIRDIWTQVSYMPRTHGSAIFTRGETQSLVSVTLGTKRDEQAVDTLFDQEAKQFMLQYNFPPFCVGEAGFLRGPGRREIGHGHLAERALKQMMPSFEEFSYVIRVISDILESNGSSSMASVCGGSMALMDAGVPLKKPVSGIAMGLIVGETEEDTVILSDIRGEEDFTGDMDFKVTGTADGITACQMDIKVTGISTSIMERALEQARKGRLHILEKMAESISEPRKELSRYAPQFINMEVEADQIGSIIGPGGKVIQTLQKETDTEIWIEEDDERGKGLITITADDLEKAQEAQDRIKKITGHLEEGEIYLGEVKAIKDYGAFVEIIPGKDGLLHISEVEHGHVKDIRDVLSVGDKLEVKLLKVENGGKLRLSRKALLPTEDEEE